LPICVVYVYPLEDRIQIYRSTFSILACPVQESHRSQVEQLVVEKAATERRMAEVEQQLRGLTAESAAVAAQLTAERDRLLVWGRLGRFAQSLCVYP